MKNTSESSDNRDNHKKRELVSSKIENLKLCSRKRETIKIF